jgi:hypothetical protein
MNKIETKKISISRKGEEILDVLGPENCPDGSAFYFTITGFQTYSGHDHLLEIRLLEKSARHDFSFARHHSSNNYFFVNCSNPVNLCELTGFEQFHF